MDLTNRLLRQKDLIPQEVLGKSILIVGAGAVGSFTALTLAKMGYYNITVVDFDTIEVENLNCQFYRDMDISKKKVIALSTLVRSFTGVAINAIDDRILESTDLDTYDIVIAAVDSMVVRSLIWNKVKDSKCFYIDPRMGGESILLYSVDTNSMDMTTSYERTLYSDDEAVVERCTAKATMYTVNLIAGLIGKIVKDHSVGKPYTSVVTWNVEQNAYYSTTQE